MSEVERYLATHLGDLLEMLRGSDVEELEIRENGLRVRLHRAGESAPAVAAGEEGTLDVMVPEEPPLYEITAPLVGTFYRASHPSMAPFVSEGSVVDEDTVVGIVEALQVLTEIPAGVHGVITDVRAHDGQPVEYGQVLFGVSPGD
jgi:biotin carboxyl carrier protein